MKKFSLLVAVIAMMLLSFTVSAHAQHGPPADVATHIIVFNSGVNGRGMSQANIPDFAAAHDLQITHSYQYALNGIAAVVPQGRMQALQNDPRVSQIFVNNYHEFSADAQTVPTGVSRVFAASNPALDIDGVDDFRVDVDIAILDSGIDLDHPDLNVVSSIDCTGRRGCGAGGDDDHGHGTHVAGIAAAIDNGQGVVGVAPGARLHAVKVLDRKNSGYDSWIIAGIDWVAANASTIEVANMSLSGSGYIAAEEVAISNAQNLGVVFVVSAGNVNNDARNYSPAGFPNVITVSAITDFDGTPSIAGSACPNNAYPDEQRALFSNYGPAVDIAAPGVCILSTAMGGGYTVMSGTSQAAPHVAGAAALLASQNNPNNFADVQAIRNTLVNTGNYNYVDNSGDGIQEPLLDVSTFSAVLVDSGTGGGGGVDPEPTPAPTEEPAPCRGKKCN